MTARRDDLQVDCRGPLDRRYPVYEDSALTTPRDITGWTAAAQVRTAPRGRLLATLTVAVEQFAVRVSATGAQTTAWMHTWPGMRGYWDIVLTDPDGNLYPPLVAGTAQLVPHITVTT